MSTPCCLEADTPLRRHRSLNTKEPFCASTGCATCARDSRRKQHRGSTDARSWPHTHAQRGQRCSGRNESPPLVIRATEPILMGCCVGETVLHCMCARECLVHERVRCRQLPGGGPGPLPSASLWIREKPPVILASLQAHPN